MVLRCRKDRCRKALLLLPYSKIQVVKFSKEKLNKVLEEFKYKMTSDNRQLGKEIMSLNLKNPRLSFSLIVSIHTEIETGEVLGKVSQKVTVNDKNTDLNNHDDSLSSYVSTNLLNWSSVVRTGVTVGGRNSSLLILRHFQVWNTILLHLFYRRLRPNRIKNLFDFLRLILGDIRFENRRRLLDKLLRLDQVHSVD